MDFLFSTAFRYFLAVANYGSIREASKQLNIASSAIHRQISLLEQHLETNLFEKSGRGIVLSQTGKILQAYGQKMQLEEQEVLQKIADQHSLQQGSVRIATVESISETFLPALLADFQKKYPGIDLTISIMTSYQVEEAIISGKYHIGFMFNPSRQIGVSELYSRDFRIGAIVTQEHPLTRERDCYLAHCLQYPLILPAQNMSITALLTPALQRLGVDIKTSMRVNSLRLMRNILQQGQHVGFQTILGVEANMENEAITFLKLLDDDIKSDRLAIIVRSEHQLAHAPACFAEIAQLQLNRYFRQLS